MDTLRSKAFWLGRSTNIIGFTKAMKEDTDSHNISVLMHSATGIAKTLNIQLPDDIPSLDSKDAINQFTETVKMDIALAQSEWVANCFMFGFNLTSWGNLRGGYGNFSQSEIGIDLNKVEATLRNEARLIGISQKHLNKVIEAAKNSTISNEQFKELIGMEVVLAIEKELDSSSITPDHQSPKQVFIVMKMGQDDSSLVDVLDSICQVAKSLELVAYRVDELDTSGRITDSIVEALRKSDFVVVDLTGARPNVYWEAGFAHGLGKTPIYIAHEGTDIGFDIKDYPVIYYTSMKMLRDKLGSRLKNLLESW